MVPRTRYAPPRRTAFEVDAIAWLEADHEAICQLFTRYERTHTVAERIAWVVALCARLRLHMQIEDEIFSPDIHAASRGSWLPPVANLDRARLGQLVRQVETMAAQGALDNAKVEALSDLVARHIDQAQRVMFPRARASSADLIDLGARMAARKADLLARSAEKVFIVLDHEFHSLPTPIVHDPEPLPPGAPPVEPDEGPVPVRPPDDPERSPVGDPPR